MSLLHEAGFVRQFLTVVKPVRREKMSKKTLIAAAAGSAFVAGLAAAPIASAAENPFALSGLSSGYQVADSHGAKPMTSKGDETNTEAGKTSAEKDPKAAEMKATDKKMPEGKCGEGKCGAAAKSKGDAAKAEPGKTSTEK
jgi:uncharacterized low-complexity protein